MITQAVTPVQCASNIMTVIPSITRFLRTEIRYHGQPHLSLSQLRVLHFLHRKPDSSLSEVANHLDVTRPTMSAMVERLVQRGLVQRLEDPQERRRVALTLTTTGTAEMERVYGATLAKVASRLGSLSDEQRHQVMTGLSILGECFADA